MIQTFLCEIDPERAGEYLDTSPYYTS